MITTKQRTAYYAPTRKRYFFTLTAACNAEAVAIIKRRYPTEETEFEGCQMTSPGWDWTSLPRARVLQRRMHRFLMNAFKAANAEGQK